jgi:hypothetical protein
MFRSDLPSPASWSLETEATYSSETLVTMHETEWSHASEDSLCSHCNQSTGLNHWIQRVLTMVYNTQNSWGFGLFPLFGILETKNTMFRNWICFRPQVRGEDTSQLGPLERANLSLSKGPKRVGVFPPHLRTETDPVSETLCFLVSRIPNDGQSPKTQ